MKDIQESSSAGSATSPNLLGILLFCFLFGNIIGNMDDRGKELQYLFETLSQAFQKIIRSIIL